MKLFIQRVGKWKRSSCNAESSRWASGREVLPTKHQEVLTTFYNVASGRCASARDCLSRQLNMKVITSPLTPPHPPTHTINCPTRSATRHEIRMKIGKNGGVVIGAVGKNNLLVQLDWNIWGFLYYGFDCYRVML